MTCFSQRKFFRFIFVEFRTPRRQISPIKKYFTTWWRTHLEHLKNLKFRFYVAKMHSEDDFKRRSAILAQLQDYWLTEKLKVNGHNKTWEGEKKISKQSLQMKSNVKT